jgi:hypothetical protein
MDVEYLVLDQWPQYLTPQSNQHEMGEKHDKYVAQDDTITTLEKYSTESNYQLQSNDLSDDSKTGLMQDQSEDLGNVIQDNNPKIKSEHVKCVSKVNQTKLLFQTTVLKDKCQI